MDLDLGGYEKIKIMRFVIFLGLTLIAKSIDPIMMVDAANFVLPVLAIALIIDYIDCRKRWNK